MMKQLTSWKNVHLTGGIGGIYFEEKELSAILPHYNYGAALAYLWRRFGPSVNGWDGFKELTLYVLTTKMKGVFLTCNCYVDSPHIAFGFGFSEERLPNKPAHFENLIVFAVGCPAGQRAIKIQHCRRLRIMQRLLKSKIINEMSRIVRSSRPLRTLMIRRL